MPFKTKKFDLLNDVPAPKLGAGVSRAKAGQQVRQYRLLVAIPASRPMKVVLEAPDRRMAVKFASNRWPNASVLCLGLYHPPKPE